MQRSVRPPSSAKTGRSADLPAVARQLAPEDVQARVDGEYPNSRVLLVHRLPDVIDENGDRHELEQRQAALARSDSADDELSQPEAAPVLFRDEPLAGSDLPWAENEQRRLHAVRLELLARAGHNRLTRGNASDAPANAQADGALLVASLASWQPRPRRGWTHIPHAFAYKFAEVWRLESS